MTKTKTKSTETLLVEILKSEVDSTLVEHGVMSDDEILDRHQGDEAGPEIETRVDEIAIGPEVQVTKR